MTLAPRRIGVEAGILALGLADGLGQRRLWCAQGLRPELCGREQDGDTPCPGLEPGVSGIVREALEQSGLAGADVANHDETLMPGEEFARDLWRRGDHRLRLALAVPVGAS